MRDDSLFGLLNQHFASKLGRGVQLPLANRTSLGVKDAHHAMGHRALAPLHSVRLIKNGFGQADEMIQLFGQFQGFLPHAFRCVLKQLAASWPAHGGHPLRSCG